MYVFAALLAACGDGKAGAVLDAGDTGRDAGDDASGDAGGAGLDAGGEPDGGPAGVHVTIETGVPPALIAFREERSTQWQTVPIADGGTFDLQVTGPYRVVVICRSSGRSTLVTQFARTLADEHRIEHTCGVRRAFPFHVRGEMTQEGLVSFDSAGVGRSAVPWTFDLPAAAGTFDLLVWFGSLFSGFDRIAIRRDVEVSGDLQLGTIDATKEPTHALVPTHFRPTNRDPDETLSATLTVESGHTHSASSVFDSGSGWLVPLVPDDALRPTDTQRLELTARLTTSTDPVQQRVRSVNRGITGPTEIQLMAPLGLVRFVTTPDRLDATWSTLPEIDELDLWRWSFPEDFSRSIFHDLLLSRNFIADVGLASATLDFTDIPGFDPAWRHDPSFTQVVGIDAMHTTALGESERSGVSQDLAPPGTPTLGAQRARRLAEELRAQPQRDRAAHARARRALASTPRATAR